MVLSGHSWGLDLPRIGAREDRAVRSFRRNPPKLVGRHPGPPAGSSQRGVPAPHPPPTYARGPPPTPINALPLRSPSRRSPGRSFLLYSLFAAQRPPSPAPPRTAAASALRGEGGGTDWTESQQPLLGPQPRSHRPRRSHPPLLSRWAPSPSSALPQRPRGGAPGAPLGSTGHRPAAAAAARPPRAAPKLSRPGHSEPSPTAQPPAPGPGPGHDAFHAGPLGAAAAAASAAVALSVW